MEIWTQDILKFDGKNGLVPKYRNVEGLFMVAMYVLARQCSRVFNVVTVNVVVSIIPNIQ